MPSVAQVRMITAITTYLSTVKTLLANALTPTGQVSHTAAATVPSGWLEANGDLVSRTQYARLFKAIGTTYGAGDGVTTFKLPDLRGEFIRGWDHGRGVDSGRAAGSAQGDMYGRHSHSGSTNSGGSHTHTGSTAGAGGHGHAITINNGGTHSHSGQLIRERIMAQRVLEDPPTTGNAVLGDESNSADGYQSFSVSGGSHSHTGSASNVADHSHTLTLNTAGGHSHDLSINTAGGIETRPRNLAFMGIIKY